MSLNITSETARVVRIDREHKLFWAERDCALIPRAAIELAKDCPNPDYVLYLISKGFVKTVAYVTEEEYMMIKLSHE